MPDLALLEGAAIPGGDCLCGRGAAIGSLSWTSGRMWFRAFHDGPAAFHHYNAADWACADCVADTAVAIASGEVREAMRQIAATRRAPLASAPEIT